MKVQAKDNLTLVSANAEAEFAAKQAVHLSNAAGASITLEGGKITVTCPGNMTIHARQKVFTDSGAIPTKLPIMPESVCIECLMKRAAQRSAFVNKGA